MNALLKLGYIIALQFLVIIALGSATEITTGGGISVSALDDSSAQGSFEANHDGATSFLTGSGRVNFDDPHWVRNSLGYYVEVGASSTNALNPNYYYQVYPAEGNVVWNGPIWAFQTFDVDSADSIYAYAIATNNAGDYANVILDIRYGSLTGYRGDTYVGPWAPYGVERGAFVSQTVDYATGDDILVKTEARNALSDRASSITHISHGSLDEYSAEANANKATNGQLAAGVKVNSLSASAPSGSISQDLLASDYWNDYAHVGAYINNGGLISYPYSSNIPSLAYSLSELRVVRAIQSVDAYSTGSGNYLTNNLGAGDLYYGLYFNNQPIYQSTEAKFWSEALIDPNPYNDKIQTGTL